MKSITIENVSKQYGSGSAVVDALCDVNLHIETGEFFFLLGPSGCGKTTLLRTIAGLLEPTGGRILFDQADVTALPVEKRNTAMVFQSYALWPHMTIYQNVEFGPKMKGVSAVARREQADKTLQLVQLEGMGKRRPNQLSGGQQQRVALGRALAAGADCLLLDEPLSNLDAKLRLTMRSELRRLVKTAGATAIYVTHDQKEALSMADRIAVMNGGRIVQVGTPEEIYNYPATTFVADFIGEANFVDGKVAPCGAMTTIETAVGKIASGDVPKSTEQTVTCCIRPEWISLVSADTAESGNLSLLPVKIVSQTYLGEMRQYVCELDDGRFWRVSQMGGHVPFAAGDAARLAIPAEHVRLLES